MAILERIRCTNCGGEFEEYDPKATVMRCSREGCHATFIIRQAAAFAKVQMDHDQDIYTLRRLMLEALESKNPSALYERAIEIRKWIPDDFYATFFQALARKLQGKPNDFYQFIQAYHGDDMTEETRDFAFETSLEFFKIHDKEPLEKFIFQNYATHLQSSKQKILESHVRRIYQEQNRYAEVPRDIFICYSSSDTEIALRIYDILTADGNTCWISERNLPPDTVDYWDKIITAIYNSKIILVISSLQCMLRDDTQKEMRIANDAGLKRLEYKIDRTEHTTFFKHYFDGLQWVNGIGHSDGSLDMLCERIYQLSNITNQNGGIRKRKRWFLIIIILAALLFLSVKLWTIIYPSKPWSETTRPTLDSISPTQNTTPATSTSVPTITLTPTGTPIPTDEPTPEPTDKPEPTPEPSATPEPTPVPSSTPTSLPYVSEGTDINRVELTSMVYNGTNATNEYERAMPVKMNGPADYAAWSGAVLTFRGGPFRQNAAYGTVDIQKNKLEVIWSTPMGGIASYYGAGWMGQPAIVKWTKEVREMMNLTDEKKAVTALKEVILASQDGKVYFLDLADGQPTRDPINIGYPLKGTVSIDPRGMPMLSVGQAVSKINNTTGDIGFFVFSLINQEPMMFLNGRDKNAYGANGAFYGSSLLDLNSDTLITAGGNGMLYTIMLNTTFDVGTGKLDIDPKISSYKAKASNEKNTQTCIDGSVAMYENYAYFADNIGILQCVDVNTMEPVWAVDTGDNTDATIALDFDEVGSLALYTGNTVKEQGKDGICTIRRLNALTGEQEWSCMLNVGYDSTEITGCMASPVIGQQSIGNMVIFTVAKAHEGGEMIALDKKTGHMVWQQPMSSFSYSSPVAVYNENGDAWIIQGDSKGVLQLMDGKTGTLLDSIQLEGSIIASPVVYNDTLVIGTSGKGVSKIYGIKIK